MFAPVTHSGNWLGNVALICCLPVSASLPDSCNNVSWGPLLNEGLAWWFLVLCSAGGTQIKNLLQTTISRTYLHLGPHAYLPSSHNGESIQFLSKVTPSPRVLDDILLLLLLNADWVRVCGTTYQRRKSPPGRIRGSSSCHSHRAKE